MTSKSQILLVDDKQAITDNLSPFLEQSGFVLAVAADGEEALRQVSDPLPLLRPTSGPFLPQLLRLHRARPRQRLRQRPERSLSTRRAPDPMRAPQRVRMDDCSIVLSRRERYGVTSLQTTLARTR